MKHVEFEAMRELTRTETKVYLHLRHHMDYATGIVGAVRKISYQSIHEYIEEVPPRGSKDPVYKPSKQQINRVLRKLEAAGVIERLHSGKPNEYMVFKLVLAATDLDRPNEERHMSDTRAATRGATQQNPSRTRPAPTNTDTMSDKGATPDDRHTSDTSVLKDLSLTRANNFEGSTAGMDLTFTKEFIQLAKLTGLDKTPEQIQGMFEVFRYHQKHRKALRQHSDWLAEWRIWCGREKSYGQTKTTRHSGPGQSYRPENPTAKLLRESKEAAAELARTGYYDSGSESGESS